MAIILDTNIPSNTVQVLGELPADSLDDVLLSLTSVYDGATYRVAGTGSNSGNWVRATIPSANIPDFSGQYTGELSTTVEMPLTLNTTFSSLSELTITLRNFVGAGQNDAIVDNIPVRVIGRDEPTITNNIITPTTTEYEIPVEADLSYQGLEPTTTEYDIPLDEDVTYTQIDDSRTTYHN